MDSYNALMIALAATLAGTQITYFYDENTPWPVRVCAGACIGFAGLGLIGFIFASVLGLGPLCLAFTTVTLFFPIVIFTIQRYSGRPHGETETLVLTTRGAIDNRVIIYIGFYSVLAVLLWFFFHQVMLERAGEIYTIENNGGDLPLHIGIMTGFVHGTNFPPEHPEFAGARFTYPFLPDFIAALFARAGASLQGSMFLENFVLALALLGLLHYWVLNLTRDALAAFISPVLILFSGGLGWLSALRDIGQSKEDFFALLMHLPRGYTVMWDGIYRWGNILNMLAMQRTLLLGLPLSVIVLTLWWKAIGDGEYGSSDTLQRFRIFQRRRMIAAGAIAGSLPLIHTYTFIVVMGIGACLTLLFRQWRAWSAFFTVALLVAAPQVFLLLQDSAMRAENFFAWHWGLYLAGYNFFWFWFMNTGIFIPLLVITILWRGRTPIARRALLLFYLPFAFCFVVPNLVRLAPWRWDGLKVILFWYVASVPLIALLLARLWRGNGLLRPAAIVLFVSLIAAGSLDIWRGISGAAEQRLYDRDAVAFADTIVKRTHPRALILHAPYYNEVVFLTGRRSVMGNTDHLFSHGLDYRSRATDVKHMLAGGPDAHALMKRYRVEYVVIEPVDIAALPFNNRSFTINKEFFERYPIVAELGAYRLYEISGPGDDSRVSVRFDK